MKTQSPILSSLKTLVFFIGLFSIASVGACSFGVVVMELVVDPARKIELSFDTTIEELKKECANLEMTDENYASWSAPKCVDGVRLEVIFNPRTRKLMSWKTYTKPKEFNYMVYDYQIRDKTTIDDLKKSCGDTTEEKPGRAKWAHPDCMIVKTLEVVFEPKTGKILEWKKHTWEDTHTTMVRK